MEIHEFMNETLTYNLLIQHIPESSKKILELILYRLRRSEPIAQLIWFVANFRAYNILQRKTVL